MWAMLTLTVLMVVMLIWNRWRPDIIALAVLAILGISHVIPTQWLFVGFSSQAVIALIAAMIIGTGIEQAGLLQSIAQKIERQAKRGPRFLIVMLCIAVALMAGVLRSAGSLSLILPTINRIATNLHMPRSKLLLPVGFCAIAGSTITLIGSGSLLVLNDIMTHQDKINYHLINLFTLTPISLMGLASIIVCFLLLYRWLPATQSYHQRYGADSEQFRKIYGHGGQFFEVSLPKQHVFRKATVGDVERLIEPYKVALVGVATHHEVACPALRNASMEEVTNIVLLGSQHALQKLTEQYTLNVKDELDVFAESLAPSVRGFGEIVVPPGSTLVGVPVSSLHMRRSHHLQMLSVYRGDRYYHGEEMLSLEIHAGDTIGVLTDWQHFAELEKDPSFAMITSDFPRETFKPEMRIHTVVWVVTCLVMIVCFNMDAAIALLYGAVGILLTGVVKPDEAYRNISWSSVFLLAGLIPYGIAMQHSGAANWIAEKIMIVGQDLPAWGLLFGLGLIAALFSLLMSNVGATVVLVPIAIHIAHQVGANPWMFAAVAALSTVNAFILPTHQVSAIIMGPGNFKPKHFLIFGSIITLVYEVVIVAGANLWLGH